MIVYLCTNIITKKHYVGITSQTFQKRKSVHKHNALTKNLPNYFYRSIRKYGWDNFIWNIIEDGVCDFAILNSKEIEYIEKYNAFTNGYNMTIGGDGTVGYKHTEEAKNKISNATKGISKGPLSEDHYNKISKINKSRCGKTYEELYGVEKAKELKAGLSRYSKELHDNQNHKEWLKMSYDEKYNEKAEQIKSKMSTTHKNKLVNGKRVNISEAGLQRMRDAKLGSKNNNYVEVDIESQELIIRLYKTYGKIVPEILQESGYSKHVIKRFLKDIKIYAGRKKYKDGNCSKKIPKS
jgi:hypothetical protein